MGIIGIVGAGYVGLVSAACFAKKGNKVVVLEKDSDKVKLLSSGEPHFYEPGLKEIVSEGVTSGLLSFTTSIKEMLEVSPQMIFSCVGTPSMPDGSVDMSYVKSVAREIGQNLTSPSLIINKSTVPVGTAKEVFEIINLELTSRGVSIDFDVASNPEFLREGSAVADSMFPDRVVVGVNSKSSQELLYNLYKPFLTSDDQFISMNCESSELTKYASNSMLATRISFMNQLALLADKVGADINQVKVGMSYDARIGSLFLNAGIGYGGSCFPKDVRALVDMGKKYDQPMTIVKEVDAVNNRQRQWFIDFISKHYGNLSDKKVAILGLAFKPDTDDIRYAPSIDVINQLHAQGAHISAYDPVAVNNIKNEVGNKAQFVSAQEAIENSDFAIILTEWAEIKSIDIDLWLKLAHKTVFDARNCLDPSTMVANGIQYFSIGRNSLSSSLEFEGLVNSGLEVSR